MVKLSIIIPVYNTEEYLPRCLNSCLEQDLPANEYEIIAINDGSSDNSLQILNAYALKYPNIRVINQENRGLGATRNRGLNLAIGEYIWFVDSDDWVLENCLLDIYENCKDVDILETDRAYLYKDHVVYINIAKWTGVPGYIFNREFLIKNKLIFRENIYFEDSEFTPRVLYLSNKTVLYKKAIYYYQRTGSIVHSESKKHCTDLILIIKSLYTFIIKHTDNLKDKQILYFYLRSSFNAFIQRSLSFSYKERKQLYKILISEDAYDGLLTLSKKGTKIKLYLMTYLPYLLPLYCKGEQLFIYCCKR
jgi:glycosyltransferase involved capsular polysaccharide biosynthesis